MIVELAGPIGAGKSAVAEALPDALRERGLAASQLNDIARLTRPRTWLWNCRFALAHPRLVWSAWRAVSRAPIPWWHRRLILGLVLGVGGRIDYARSRVPKEHVILVDEGLVHRSVNLFGWWPKPSTDLIRRYIGLVPLPEALIYVEADPSAEYERAMARGVPKRLIGRSEQEVAAFVRQAREVSTAAVEAVETRGATTVVRVKNRQSLRRAVGSTATAMRRLAEGAVATEASEAVFRPVGPLIRRPDRLVARWVAGGRRSVPQAQLVAVLERYGLAMQGRPRTLSAPGSRGATSLVRTADGDVVVKRYKDSVDDSALAIEHLVLDALADHGFPAPRLRRAAEGRTFVSLDGSRFALTDAIRGYRHPHELVMTARDRRQLAVIAGTLLANLHRTLEATEVPPSASLGFVERGGPRVRDVEWHTRHLATAPAPRRIRAWADAALWRLSETFEADALPVTVVHGDYGPYNLLLRPGSAPVLVDFELARLDWRLVDLATGLPWYAQRRRGFDVDGARRMLDAYRTASGAPEGELLRIPEMLAFLALQRAVVAWMRTQGNDAPAWDSEARYRITLAEDLLAGRHPLNAVLRRW